MVLVDSIRAKGLVATPHNHKFFPKCTKKQQIITIERRSVHFPQQQLTVGHHIDRSLSLLLEAVIQGQSML